MSELSYRVPNGIGVAIIAPGGYAEDQVAYEHGIARLEAMGCRVKSYYDPAAKFQRFGGTDEARAAQIHAAFRDPDVKIVMALRGGYGCSRLLNMIDYDALAASGKMFVGHSDLTALQLALLAKTGAPSFSGPMICPDFTRDEISGFTTYHFWQCVANPSHKISVQAAGNPVVDVSGKMWGGNLSMLAHLLGTEYFPSVEGGILCLEDISEHPYRVERMMIELIHAGVLEKQRAVVLGDFSGYKLNDYDNGYDFDSMVGYLRSSLKVPVLTGLPLGHIRDKVTLAVGCNAKLASRSDGFDLSMSGHPTL